MLPLTRVKILFTVLLVSVIVGGTFLLVRAYGEAIETSFRNGEAFFAETPQTPPAASSTAERIRVPILVYHIIRPSYPSDSPAVKSLAQTPEVFDAQMQYLADAGYRVIPFSALENNLKDGAPLPPHPIVISLDDGWSDQFTYAFPLLKKYQYPATFFVFTNPIGSRGFLTWEELRTLRDAGMTIGAHTRSHPFLTKITDPAILWREIAGSKQTLEKNLGITVNEFAYPFGRYDAAIVAMVEKAGYTAARGDYLTKKELPNPLYELGALNAPTTVDLFARKFPIVK